MTCHRFATALMLVLAILLSDRPAWTANAPEGAHQKDPDALPQTESLPARISGLYDKGDYLEALPLARDLVDSTERAKGPEAPETAVALNWLGRLCRALGYYDEAAAIYQKALVISERTAGPEAPRTATVLNNLAVVYRHQARFAEALPLQERAVAIDEKIWGRDHPETAIDLNNLAILLKEMGHYALALPVYQRALAIKEAKLPPHNASLAKTLNDLADLHKEMGRYDMALALYQQALSIQTKTLGDSHPETASSMNRLAQLHKVMGKYDLALKLHQEALSLREKRLGAHHPDTAGSYHDLCLVHDSLSHYDIAMKQCRRALEIRNNRLGATHPETADSLSAIGILYMHLGRYEEALPLYEQAMQVIERTLGPAHPKTAELLTGLGELQRIRGRNDEALSFYERSLAIKDKSLGPSHPSTAVSLNNLALLLKRIGRYDRALELYEQALKIDEETLGPEHPYTAVDLNNMARLYEALGQYDKALPLSLRTLAIDEKVYGKEHPETAIDLNNLARLFKALKRYDIALPLYQRALQIREKSLGKSHPDTAVSLDCLGEFYVATGQGKKALPLHRKALAIRRHRLGPDHPDTAASLNLLATAYRLQGRPDLALPAAHQALPITLQARIPPQLALVASNLGEIYHELHQPATAVFYLKISVNAFQSIRENANGLDVEAQRSLLKTTERSYSLLAKLLADQGRLTEAEEVLAMLKEQEQFEFVQRATDNDPRRSQVSLSQEEMDLKDRLQSNADNLTNIRLRMRALPEPAQRTPEEQKSWNKLRDRQHLESKTLAELWDTTERRLQRLHGAIGLPDELRKGRLQAPLEALHKATGAEPALVYYLPSKSDTTFILQTRDTLLLLIGGVGEARLNELVHAFRQAMKSRDPYYSERAQTLYKALIAPIEPQLVKHNIDTLMLYLRGTLRYLPFPALQDSQGRHLVEKYSLTLYTAAAQPNLKDEAILRWTAAALGVSKARPRFSALPGVALELTRIVRRKDAEPGGIMDGVLYLDEEFTRQRFIALMDGKESYPVMHLATHFNLKSGQARDSFLLLGDGEELNLAQMMDDQGIKLGGYDLVTLSACETALGNGREIEGLGVAFQEKGAKAVLATLWKVEDIGTATLMEHFYTARGENWKMTKAKALQRAQIAMLEGKLNPVSPERDLRHPYFWAPFVLMGNWR